MPELQELDLSGNGFTHLGYSKICRLVNLQELSLSRNALTNMPYCLSNLTNLRTLELSHNQLNGDLSSFVSNLPLALEYLSLLHNNFNGSFSFNSLVNHTRLKVFKLSSESGMIQPQVENSWVPSFQLNALKLRNFNLGDIIPSFLVHQCDLYFVDLSNNNLTGTFPSWLVQNNTRLQWFLLRKNSLTKLQLPRLAHGLEVLDISSNRIYNSLQEDIGIIFPNLRFVNFSSNHFQGTIPSSMGNMESLEMLDLSSNDFIGKLPTSFLSGCYALSFLKLSNNKFQGEIFPEHANLTSLRMLALDGNVFNGSLGKGLLNSKYLRFLDISNNSIYGPLPLWIDRLSNLEYLNIRGNQLKGFFPSQLQNLQKLQTIDISDNSFSGSIPKEFGFEYLVELRLQNNEFTGTIPDSLFKDGGLHVLDLGRNRFSGKIPNTIGKSYHLRVLLLRNNDLQSHIPLTICHLSRVNLLDLSHNKLEGTIPSCFSTMSFGKVSFDALGGDEGFGERYFDFLPSFPLFDVHDYVPLNSFIPTMPTTRVVILTKSRYETYQGEIIDYMYGLDLSNNKLSGEIPYEIGNLMKILSLNLSSNRLTGPIPDSFSWLKDLESLDLSNNKLHGRIPPQLADLNNIGSFNVSCNNLSGEIPFKNHLVTFDERSYIGDAHLYGCPIKRSCNSTTGVSQPSASKHANEEEEEVGGVIDMVWFYWTCAAVYISTALASFAFFCIDSRWSRECFYRVDLVVHHIQRCKDRFVCN